MRAPSLPLGPPLALVLVLPSLGCVDRVIRPADCGNDRIDVGEVCLGRGERSSLPISGMTGQVLRVADFDGDDHLDLLVLGQDAAGAVTNRMWRGHGDGRFDDPTTSNLAGCSAYAVAGNVDDDPHADVVMDECGPSLSLFRGDPGGAFTGPASVATGVVGRRFGLVDLDRDDLREVVVLGTIGEQTIALSVSEADVQGNFAPPKISELGSIAGGLDPSAIGLLDVDDDENYDAVLIHAGQPGGLRLAPGTDEFAFGAPRPVGPPTLTIDTALVRDLDEDGRPDLLAVSFEQSALVFLQPEGGDLVEHGRTEVPDLQLGPAGGGDIDADGHYDLLLFEPGTRKLQAWLGRGDGRFDGPQDVAIDDPVGQIALADLDEDGALDIVAGTFDQDTLQILLSDP